MKFWIIAIAILVSYQASANTLTPGSDMPVEITSDTLEVDQEKHLATFLGKVEAIQGDVNLRSDKMVVHYKEEEKKPETDNKKQGTQFDAMNNAVSRIEASGNVLLSTPLETAKGTTGLYEVEKNIITLEGTVILAKGKNILKGEKLVYDMTSGQSKLNGQAGKNRVKGVFIPEKKENKR